jgi:hypothetical protein
MVDAEELRLRRRQRDICVELRLFVSYLPEMAVLRCRSTPHVCQLPS